MEADKLMLRIEGRDAGAKRRGYGDDANGKYIYCVVEGVDADFDLTGMEDKRVSTVRHGDLSAMVQDAPQGLCSKDSGVLQNLIIAHHKVVDAAVKRCGAALPFCFGNVVTGGEYNAPAESVSIWLRENYGVLKGKLEKVRGKAEYGVQVLWNPQVMAALLTAATPELKRLEQAARQSSPGRAFMYKEELKMALRRETEAMADARFRDFYARIKNIVDEVKVDGVKKVEGVERMLLNLSCLARVDKSEELGRLLDEIEKEGFTARFTGPWPPYSFV